MRAESEEAAIIGLLDDTPAPSDTAMLVAMDLLRAAQPKDPLIAAAVDLYATGKIGTRNADPVRKQLIARLKSPDDPTACAVRLAYVLFSEGGMFDGYLAEYLYGWAKDCGLTDKAASSIIKQRLIECGRLTQ